MSRLPLISLILFLMVSCGGSGTADLSKPEGQMLTEEAEKTEVYLLYPEEGKDLLAVYKTTIESRGKKQLDMEELIRRYLSAVPEKNLVNPFPERSELRALFLWGEDTAVVDLNSGALEGGGSETETYRIYGLVNTLCLNYPEIRSVKFLIDGEERETLLGHVDLQHPIPPEPSLNGPVSQ